LFPGFFIKNSSRSQIGSNSHPKGVYWRFIPVQTSGHGEFGQLFSFRRGRNRCAAKGVLTPTHDHFRGRRFSHRESRHSPFFEENPSPDSPSSNCYA
jgi:hypothetical protein